MKPKFCDLCWPYYPHHLLSLILFQSLFSISTSFSIATTGFDFARVYGGTRDDPSLSTAGATKSTRGRTFSEQGGESVSNVNSGKYTSGSSTEISAGGVGRGEAPSLFSDDASFERQYNEPEECIKVAAPAGKLGVVIDTPRGGIPVVHAIKDTSVLADQIQVGDRLISVDDVDTTRMTAIDVSRLISKKTQNPVRQLVFLRNRTED